MCASSGVLGFAKGGNDAPPTSQDHCSASMWWGDEDARQGWWKTCRAKQGDLHGEQRAGNVSTSELVGWAGSSEDSAARMAAVVARGNPLWGAGAHEPGLKE